MYYGLTYRAPPPSSSSFASRAWNDVPHGGGGGGRQGGNKRWDRGEGEGADDGGVGSKRRLKDRSGGGGEEGMAMIVQDFSSENPPFPATMMPTTTTTTTTGAGPISWVLHPAMEEIAFFPLQEDRGEEEHENERTKGGRGGTGAWQAAHANAAERRVRSSTSPVAFSHSSLADGGQERSSGGGGWLTRTTPFQCPSAALFLVKDDLRQLMVGEIQRWLVVRGRPPALPPRVWKGGLSLTMCTTTTTPSSSLLRRESGLAAGREGSEKEKATHQAARAFPTAGARKAILQTPTPTHPASSFSLPSPSSDVVSLPTPLSSHALDTTSTSTVLPIVKPEGGSSTVSPVDTPHETCPKEKEIDAVVSVKDFFSRFIPISKRKGATKGTEKPKRSEGLLSSPSSGGVSPGGEPSKAEVPPVTSLTTGGGAGRYVKYIFFDGATNAVKVTARFEDF